MLKTSEMQSTERSHTGLAPGWSITERVDERIEIQGVELWRAALSAESTWGEVVTGAAADVDGRAMERATFELLERATMMEAMRRGPETFVVRSSDGTVRGSLRRESVFAESDDPQRWQPSRSNGVALGTDWASACRSALLELVERDRLLRSWRGEGMPEQVALDAPLLSSIPGYAWQAYRLPMQGGWSAAYETAIVIGFPTRGGVPLVRGSAADETLKLALRRAVRECLQGLAFLWGEDIPNEPPPSSPTPLYHLDHYLWPGAHAGLRQWLAGAHTQLAASASPEADATVEWVELTPAGAQARFRVAQARCQAALPLFFGDGPAWWTTALPPALRVHPIA